MAIRAAPQCHSPQLSQPSGKSKHPRKEQLKHGIRHTIFPCPASKRALENIFCQNAQQKTKKTCHKYFLAQHETTSNMSYGHHLPKHTTKKAMKPCLSSPNINVSTSKQQLHKYPSNLQPKTSQCCLNVKVTDLCQTAQVAASILADHFDLMGKSSNSNKKIRRRRRRRRRRRTTTTSTWKTIGRTSVDPKQFKSFLCFIMWHMCFHCLQWARKRDPSAAQA